MEGFQQSGVRATGDEIGDRVGGDRGEEYPVAVVPGRDEYAGAQLADDRRVVGGTGAEPVPCLDELVLGEPGYQLDRRAQQVQHGTRGHGRIGALRRRGAHDHLAVGARD